MRVTEKIRLAVCDGNTGVVLTAKAIIALVLAMFPDTNPASITVSDRARSDRQAKPYADYLFNRVAGGYEVLAPENRTSQPKTGRSTSQSAAMTLTDALAVLAAHRAKQTPQADALATLPVSDNGNGDITEEQLEALTAPE